MIAITAAIGYWAAIFRACSWATWCVSESRSRRCRRCCRSVRPCSVHCAHTPTPTYCASVALQARDRSKAVTSARAGLACKRALPPILAHSQAAVDAAATEKLAAAGSEPSGTLTSPPAVGSDEGAALGGAAEISSPAPLDVAVDAETQRPVGATASTAGRRPYVRRNIMHIAQHRANMMAQFEDNARIAGSVLSLFSPSHVSGTWLTITSWVCARNPALSSLRPPPRLLPAHARRASYDVE
ncbi:hypothetical protein EON66_03275 [archaeon]|nr:MAG: hypothetical protein EON66_03275 [archaeon]